MKILFKKRYLIGAFVLSMVLLFYYSPGSPPRTGDWFGSIQVDLKSGKVLNTIKLGRVKDGKYKFKWHVSELGHEDKIDIAYPIPIFTPNAQIGDNVSGLIIIKDDSGVEYLRHPFDIHILDVKAEGGQDSYEGPNWFGNDIRINQKLSKPKNLHAEVIVIHIDHESFTDDIGLNLSFFESRPCRHIQCLFD